MTLGRVHISTAYGTQYVRVAYTLQFFINRILMCEVLIRKEVIFVQKISYVDAAERIHLRKWEYNREPSNIEAMSQCTLDLGLGAEHTQVLPSPFQVYTN